MTPNLPQKLWRPLSEVKRYVEKFPDGVLLANLKNKVGAFKTLATKEQAELLEFLQQRESNLILKVRPLKAKKSTLILRHKRFGYPKSIAGYEYPIASTMPIIAPRKPVKKEALMTSITPTPEALRKQANELLKAAEEAEKKASQNDIFNKQFQPIRLESLQAIAKVQKLFDEQMDAMDALESAAKKLREFTI